MPEIVEKPPIEHLPITKSVIEVVADYTTTQDNDAPIILVNPGSGNAPFIYGTSIAQEVRTRLAEKGIGNAKIVVPLLYGDRQKNILLEENKVSPEAVYIDEQFGQILQRILFRKGNYFNHLHDLTDYYGEIDLLLSQRFSLPSSEFSARSLTGGEQQVLSSKNIIATIDAGSRVLINAPLRYFAFPVLFSELIHESIDEGLFGNDESSSYRVMLEGIAERMLKLEAQYAKVFIPQINTLSFKDSDPLADPKPFKGIHKTPTPALEREIQPREELKKPSVYVMLSGTGFDYDPADLLVRGLGRNVDVYAPPWANLKRAIPANPEIMADKNIIAVFGRAGWGTGWRVQNLAKPWIVESWIGGLFQAGERGDPEIHFNNKTIEALGLGKVLKDPSYISAWDWVPNSEALANFSNQISPGLVALNRRIKEKFGTLDGIAYVGKQIAEDYLNSISQSTKINK